MNELSSGTRRRLEYAAGYLQLEMAAEARAELAGVAEAEREHPGVLAMELEVAMAERAWTRAGRLAERLRKVAPGLDAGWLHGAYAARRSARGPDSRRLGLARAKALLSAAEERLGARCALLHYNLACYHAQLGELDASRERLARAIAMEPGYGEMAKGDEDLAPLGL